MCLHGTGARPEADNLLSPSVIHDDSTHLSPGFISHNKQQILTFAAKLSTQPVLAKDLEGNDVLSFTPGEPGQIPKDSTTMTVRSSSGEVIAVLKYVLIGSREAYGIYKFYYDTPWHGAEFIMVGNAKFYLFACLKIPYFSFHSTQFQLFQTFKDKEPIMTCRYDGAAHYLRAADGTVHAVVRCFKVALNDYEDLNLTHDVISRLQRYLRTRPRTTLKMQKIVIAPEADVGLLMCAVFAEKLLDRQLKRKGWKAGVHSDVCDGGSSGS
mmetsp:Transcript_32289/g.62187  ORF Transcript_32289/g.62187 Transcript_32289/m.62187 type:complete len:268 (-) Transcript_32289:645-1448(-)